MTSDRFKTDATGKARGTVLFDDGEETGNSSRRATPWHGNEDTSEAWPLERPTLASLEEILYAQRLRLRLREYFPDAQEKRVPPWCVGAD